jgi:3'-phosphoadenosine 5'-phosphosulfate (PAPS) 3'-phosphatase
MIDAVVSLVREVGASLVEWRKSGGARGQWEGTQFHAEADAWAHSALCRGLASVKPGTPVVSEEDPASQGQNLADRYWIIDPIDGTASYAGGFPGYVTQVALMESGQPSLAVVFAPEHGDLFTAERGSGAFRNGSRLMVKAATEQVLVDNYSSPKGIAADLYRDLGFTRYLESGSIGLKICRVAEGAAHVFFKSVPVRDWDLAPPQLILEESGGYLSDSRGKRIKYGSSAPHDGLIATRDAIMASRVAQWRLNRELQ